MECMNVDLPKSETWAQYQQPTFSLRLLPSTQFSLPTIPHTLFHQSPHTLKAFVGQCSFCSFCVSLESQETTKKINLRSAATRCHLDLLTTSPRNKVPFVDVTPHSQSTRAWVGVRDLVLRCFFSAHQDLYISCKYRKQTKIHPHCTGFTWKALKL